ncbi:MAG: DUF5343 domain-containing protein [Opitutaceae bacterium]|nr:DUF5343 domain-containing protein [Opitutaceae bacterium]
MIPNHDDPLSMSATGGNLEFSIRALTLPALWAFLGRGQNVTPDDFGLITLLEIKEEKIMATKIPYVNQPGSIVRILHKIQEAKAPDRFTQDFLETKLGFRGGNFRQFIPLAKKLGFLNTDGTPSELYKKFRNSESSGAAMAAALKAGYKELFDRNEYANGLTKEQFKGLVVEVTGLESKSRVVQLVCQTFDKLKQIADFEKALTSTTVESKGEEDGGRQQDEEGKQDFDLNLAYTINLVLPKTDDPAVFNAIFRALRENLIRR